MGTRINGRRTHLSCLMFEISFYPLKIFPLYLSEIIILAYIIPIWRLEIKSGTVKFTVSSELVFVHARINYFFCIEKLSCTRGIRAPRLAELVLVSA